MVDASHNHEFLNVAIWSVSLALLFQLVSTGITHWTKPVSGRQFVYRMVSAGAVGLIVGLLTEGFGLNRWFSDVVIAICGYIGAPLLDIVVKEVPELLSSVLDGAESRLSKGSKVFKDDRRDESEA